MNTLLRLMGYHNKYSRILHTRSLAPAERVQFLILIGLIRQELTRR